MSAATAVVSGTLTTDASHVFTRSFGKDQPAIPGHDEAAWSKNRRGEFILVLPRKLITTQNTK